MKIKTTLLAGLILLSVVAAKSQTEPAVKILPTNQADVIKILFVGNAAQPVEVRFYNEDRLLAADKISSGKFQTGFTKKYDIRNINSEVFWIEVSSGYLSATYKMTESKDKKSYIPFLEKTILTHSLVASNH